MASRPLLFVLKWEGRKVLDTREILALLLVTAGLAWSSSWYR